MNFPKSAAISARRWLCALVIGFFGVGLTATTAFAAPTRPAAQKPAKATAKPKTPTKATKTSAAASKAKARAKAKSTPGAGARAKASDVRESELYGDRLDGLQVEVDALKDKIFRSKARLTLLKNTVLRGVLAGSRVILAHRNLMGSGFKLVRIVYVLDGAQIYARTDESGSLDAEDELVIYDGNLPPGPHHVAIKMTYRGHGYGVFSYLTGMSFQSDSSQSFTAPENGAIKIVSAGFEDGNLTTEMKDRPHVQWNEQPLDASGRPLPKQRRRRASSKKAKARAKASGKSSGKLASKAVSKPTKPKAAKPKAKASGKASTKSSVKK